MKTVTLDDIRHLFIPPANSHKGQNGRLLIIGGSHLFHAASLWALTIATRIVDLVHYASTQENNDIVSRLKEEYRNGIVIPRSDIHDYIKEDDCILIGPGMTRDEETEALTNMLLKRYPEKQWVIDAGALQMMDSTLIPPHAILTPHQGEFEGLMAKELSKNRVSDAFSTPHGFAHLHRCIVLLKGQIDRAANSDGAEVQIEGGNAGMTKGGTGDVLAGLIAALACKNDPFLATIAGSFINKRAGDDLYTSVGPFFHASDLADQIPKTMKNLLSGLLDQSKL